MLDYFIRSIYLHASTSKSNYQNHRGFGLSDNWDWEPISKCVHSRTHDEESIQGKLIIREINLYCKTIILRNRPLQIAKTRSFEQYFKKFFRRSCLGHFSNFQKKQKNPNSPYPSCNSSKWKGKRATISYCSLTMEASPHLIHHI